MFYIERQIAWLVILNTEIVAIFWDAVRLTFLSVQTARKWFLFVIFAILVTIYEQNTINFNLI